MSLPLFPPQTLLPSLSVSPSTRSRINALIQSPLCSISLSALRGGLREKDDDRQRRRYRPREKRLLPDYYSSQTEDIEFVLLFLFTIEGFDALTPRVTWKVHTCFHSLIHVMSIQLYKIAGQGRKWDVVRDKKKATCCPSSVTACPPSNLSCLLGSDGRDGPTASQLIFIFRISAVSVCTSPG